MRLVPAALMLSAVAVPAAAQSRAEDAARQLQDPIAQEAITMAIGSIASVVLDTRVGQLARVLGPDSDIRPSDTLRDVQRRKDPDFEARFQNDTRRAVATAGSVAVGAAAMSEELQRTADRLREAMAPLAGVLASQTQNYQDHDEDY